MSSVSRSRLANRVSSRSVVSASLGTSTRSLDAERYAELPALGWERAYRTGDMVRETLDGFAFIGRRDDQVKLGGRRLELGEIDAELSSVPGVRGAAAAVQKTAAGNPVLVGYVVGDVDPAQVRAVACQAAPGGHRSARRHARIASDERSRGR